MHALHPPSLIRRLGGTLVTPTAVSVSVAVAVGVSITITMTIINGTRLLYSIYSVSITITVAATVT